MSFAKPPTALPGRQCPSTRRRLAGICLIRLPRGAVFGRPVDESRLQAEAAGGIEIADMGGAHHDLLGFHPQQIDRGEIRFAIRLVVSGEFG